MGNSVEVGIAIGLHPCGNAPCATNPDVANFIDPLLYVGPYDPEYREVGSQPYQNFTVTIPEYFPGLSQELSLNVAHFELVSVRACICTPDSYLHGTMGCSGGIAAFR